MSSVPMAFSELSWLDSYFMDRLRTPGADYAMVAKQAALILEPAEVSAMARVLREDRKVCSFPSQNFLDLAHFATNTATLAWDANHRFGYESPMDMATEVLARIVRTMVFQPGNTLEDMMRMIASELLLWCWHIQNRERFAWNHAIRAMEHIPQEDVMRHGEDRVMACFRHLLNMAQGFLEEGPWNALKTSEMLRWAEFAFLGFGEPSPEAQAVTKQEIAWALRRRDDMMGEELRQEIEAKMDSLGEEIDARGRSRAFSDRELKL